MTDAPLHFTKRELQRLFFAPRFWAALGGAALVLGLIGPFGTFEELHLPGRLAYWAATAAATYFTGLACVSFLARLMSRQEPPRMLHFLLSGLLAGLPVTLVVWGINILVFGPGNKAIGFVPLLFYTAVISAIVSALVSSFTSTRPAAPADEPETASPAPRPLILDRLPPAARGHLSHMTVQDHYVDVRTDRGGALVLMRLGDAIAETGGVDGLRIHRSHWVARDAVVGTVRREGRLFLKMKDETLLPVSRTYLAEVRSAGLG